MTSQKLAEYFDELGDDWDNPLRFVETAFDWEPGEGPDIWQEKFLLDLAKHVKTRDFNGKWIQHAIHARARYRAGALG